MEDGKQRAQPQPPPGYGTVSRATGTQRIVSGEREGLGRCNAILSQILSRLSIIVLSWDLAPARGAPFPLSPAPGAAEFILPTPEETIETMILSRGPQMSHVGGVCLNDRFEKRVHRQTHARR